MGTYINKGNLAFKKVLRSNYVDKSSFIAIVNSTIDTENQNICATRCRRFGKSIMAKMLCAYYDKSCDSRELFKGLASYFALHESEEDFLTKDRLVRYSFALLKLEQYPKVEKLLKPYYSNPALVDGPIIVNYLFARKKQKNDVLKQIKTKLIDNQYVQFSDFEQFGAYCVIGDEQKALEKLKKILKKSPRDKYTIEEWPIMENFIKNEKFKKLLAHKEKHLN